MKKKLIILIPAGTVLALIAAFLIYTGAYYRADDIALAAVQSEQSVSVSETEYGLYFNGPSEENVLVFYPGAKVEETAYAPLMHQLAARGMDVCLVKMPFRLAFFGMNKADEVFALYHYKNRYVGGHSLGGAMASEYAAGHGEELTGVILLAAYPTEPLDGDLTLLSVYGSEDGVLNTQKVAEGRGYAPARYTEQTITGGNHAQFGNYGVQKGDGAALISAGAQQEQTADLIMQTVMQADAGSN